MTDVVVIGGGLIGLAIATEAARRGMAVRVVEAESVGRHAASASAGGVRSLNRHPAEIPLARQALRAWADLAGHLGGDCGFAVSGQIRIAEDDAAMVALEQRAAMTRALGYAHEEIIGHNALRRLEPGLAAHVQGAMITRDDGFADPLKTIHAYRRAAHALGVQIEEGRPVRAVSSGPAVETDRGPIEARVVVNAAGAWGAEIARDVGEPVPMECQALQMLVTVPVPKFVSAVIGSEGHKLSLKQSAKGHVVIGGGHLGVVDDRVGRPRPMGIAQSLATAVRVFPALSEARLARSWAGLEGIVVDGLPVIGPSGTVDGLFHAFGFCGHGFALAPLIGTRVADSIDGGQVDAAFDPFRVARFSPATATGAPRAGAA